MTGDREAPEITRPLRTLVRPGVEIVEAEARAIDLAGARVETDGAAIAYDYLVVALGAELAPGTIPGLETAHTFYTLDGAAELRAASRELHRRNRCPRRERAPLQVSGRTP